MNTITVQELKTKIDNSDDFQLIDIREEYELELATIGGEHIPLGDVLDNLDKIRKDVPVVFHCKSGARGGNMVSYLTDKGFKNLSNLEGGIIAWAQHIDNSVKIY